MENIEKAFYHDGYQLGMKAAAAGSKRQNIFDAIAEMYAAIDGLNDTLFDYARKQGQSINCISGCSWCCHQPIFALDYELDYLKNHIQNHFSETEQEAISQRAFKKNMQLQKLEGDALLNSKHPCPLLKNGLCMAYEARPVACRIYLSSDVNTCLKFYHDPEDTSNFPALLDFPMRVGRMMNEGFKAALKSSGRIAKEFRIEEKLI